MGLKVTIRNKTLTNILGVASGTFGYGMEYAALADLDAIGAIYTKTVTLMPREGNPPPRLVETPAGMLNAIGLANVGVEKFITEVIPSLTAVYKGAVIANLAGSTREEYCLVLERLESCPGIWGYEINISCPNVSHGGLAFGTDAGVIKSLTASLRERTQKPLIIKLSPNVTDIAGMAKAAEEGGADAVTCINTLLGMVIDVEKQKPFLANTTGGLSGPAIRPVGVAMVYKVSRAIGIPVIGLGGITSAEDALQYLLAGAAAIQIGTANFLDARVHGKILSGIDAFCKQHNIHDVSEIHALLRER